MARSCYDPDRLKSFEADNGNLFRQFGQGPDPDDEVVYDEENDDPACEEDF